MKKEEEFLDWLGICEVVFVVTGNLYFKKLFWSKNFLALIVLIVRSFYTGCSEQKVNSFKEKTKSAFAEGVSRVRKIS